MIVEFRFVKDCQKEVWEKDRESEVNGIMSVDFFNQDDYVTTIGVPIYDVVSYIGGQSWFNDQRIDVTFVKYRDGSWSGGLLVDVKRFAEIFGKYYNGEIVKEASI